MADLTFDTSGDGLPLGFHLQQDEDGDWVLCGPAHVVLFSEPGEPLLIGACERVVALDDARAALAHISDLTVAALPTKDGEA